MSSRKTDSLRFQLLRWLLLPLLVLFVVNAWLSDRTAVATANDAFDRLLAASVDAIAEDVEVRDGEIVVDLPYAALQLLESNLQERVFYRVVGPAGKTITGYDDLPLPGAWRRAEEMPTPYAADYRGESIYLVALKKQVYGPTGTAPIVIVVAETGEARHALSRQILLEGLTRQTVLIVAAGVLVWWGLKQGLRPLDRLADELGARKRSDLGPIDPSKVQVEVRPLIEALNRHTARIERLLESRGRMVADASHQMRTPLAEMRTQIDYSLRQADPPLLRATLLDVRTDIDRLARLVAQLMMLAQADPAVLLDQRLASVDLGALAREVTAEHVPAARRRAIDLGFGAPDETVVVAGNAVLLREVIANLLDNAIGHGRAGGVVSVSVQRDPWPTLVVVDDGPGIPVAEHDKVFERFHRGPGARRGGSGLGLSIVRDICRAHHAQLELSAPDAGSGLRVRIVFNASEAVSG